MPILPAVRSFLRSLLRRSRMERDMDDELRFHLEERINHLIADGCNPLEADQRARLELGDPLRWKEAGREARGLGPLDELRTDARYALRWLSRSPGFTLAAVCSMALGIGANTAIFGLVNRVLFDRLPVHDPEALVLLGVSTDAQGLGSSFPYPFYRQLRDEGDVLAGVLCSASMGPAVRIDDRTERVNGELVSGNYFAVLGVQPHLGRLFTQDDDRGPGAHRVVVISYRYWERRFGGDPQVIGRTIAINGHPMTIIGVAPREFHGIEPGASPDIRVPISMQAEMHASKSRLDSPREWWLQIIARVKPGVPRAEASHVLQARFKDFVAAHLKEEPDLALVVMDGAAGRPTLRREFGEPLVVLTVLVAIVLLLVCVNVANLMLARATARERELSVRLALGASRRRVAQQLLLEALMLAAAGGALGVLVSFWAARALAVLTAGPGSPLEIALDSRVLLYATALSALTGLACGLVPAVAAGRCDLAAALKLETHQVSGRRFVGRQALVVGQIALSLTLLSAAGLFSRTLANLRYLDPGFDTSHLSLVTVDPALNGYSQERLRLFYDEVIARVGTLTNVAAASFGRMPQLGQSRWGSGLTLDTGEQDDKPGPLRNAVGPDYFRTIGIPVRAGREFTPDDDLSAPPVAIVNEAFVKRYFNGVNAIGRRIGPGGPRGPANATIVGIVADSRQAEIREPIAPFWFVPYRQLQNLGGGLTLHLRAAPGRRIDLDAVTGLIAAVDKDVTVFGATTMQEQIDEQVVSERLLAVLSACFAALAALLASLGLYGVMAYVASARTREIAVRMALGASSQRILQMMLRQTYLLIGMGLILGAAALLPLIGSLRALLFGIEPTDLPTLAAAAALLAAVATLASWLPVRQATRVNPTSLMIGHQ